MKALAAHPTEFVLEPLNEYNVARPSPNRSTRKQNVGWVEERAPPALSIEPWWGSFLDPPYTCLPLGQVDNPRNAMSKSATTMKGGLRPPIGFPCTTTIWG
jgi:hypothetical protein